jgi:hypothetical protein
VVCRESRVAALSQDNRHLTMVFASGSDGNLNVAAKRNQRILQPFD